MIKTTLLSALTALLILPSIASAGTTADFDPINNNPLGYVRVVTLTTPADGAASQAEQTFTWNVTALPEGGAQRRVYRTLATGGQYFSNPVDITLGTHTYTIAAASHNRPVKIQFNSDDIEFDSLFINGVDQLATTPAEGTPGQENSQTISESTDIFATTTNATWVRAATMTTPADGAASQSEQTAVINVTYIPEGGATWRSNKTVLNGNYNGGVVETLALGPNTIIVSPVAFDRTVKLQFSSDAIEFDALTFNDVDQLAAIPAQGTPGQENSQTISESDNFAAITNNNTIALGWVTVATMTTTGDGAPSQGAQTLEMNVTYIPEGGAQMRRYNSNEVSGATFSGGQDLILGSNTITVPAAVGWANPSQGRATKVQFSSVAIEFDALTFNGVDQLSTPAAGTPGTGNPISDSSNVIPANYNGSWYVATMTTPDDGAASQGEQTAVINVTYIPEGGATWRSNSTNANDIYNSSETQALVIGENTITVSAVDFDRTVKIQFSSNAIEFDALTFNGVDPLAVDDGGDKLTIANSKLFSAGPDANWVAVLTTAVSQDGASSQSEQTVVMNVTTLPAGANYRVVKTVSNGTWYAGDSQALGLGANTITVNSVAFDRNVKIQFSSDAVEYNALSVNGVDRVIGATVAEAPNVSIDGSTLTWTETDGTTLQFSDDLESWTSLPSATSPYSPTTTPDRFYRTISEEE